MAQRYAEINDEALEMDEEVEKITIVCPKRKKAKWDCETVVSAYSNIYNRPSLIDDSSRKTKLKSVLRQLEVCLFFKEPRFLVYFSFLAYF